MNEEHLSSDVLKEVLTIILYSDSSIQNKIPTEIIQKITNLAKESEKEIHLDKNKSLEDQGLSPISLDMFALLYYLYVAQTDEKDKILSSWVSNDKNTSF